MECPSCAIALPTGARYCLHCGREATQPDTSTPLDPLREVLKVALGRQYEIVSLLGQGGMGAVYLARETALDREVAIKVLPPDRGTTPESRERFRREAKTAARLMHPNIVPLHTFGDVDGTLFFVMGYVRGESLAAKMKRDGRLGVDEARRILVEISEALQYAHKLGIVHRDVKPDNVLIDAESGRAMLTDFGVAKARGAGDTMTAEGSLLGTPQYMSPEQAQGRSDIDTRSDIYSLGVMGYAMLAGRLPFAGATTAEVLMQHITRDAVPLATIVSDVPAEMSSALMRCLAKHPDERWHDADALRAALTPNDEDDLPTVLSPIQGLAQSVVVLLAMLACVFLWWAGGGDNSEPLFIAAAVNLGALSAIFAAVLAEKVRAARKEGFAWERISYEIVRRPRWWTGGYPRRYRPKNDLWPRFPRTLRRARNGMLVFVLGSIFLLLPAFILGEAFSSHVKRTGSPPYPERTHDVVTFALVGTAVALFSWALMSTAAWERFAKSHGVHDANLRSHALGYSIERRSFWSKPEIAALLSPAATLERRDGPPQSPRDLVDAIAAAVRDLDPTVLDLGGRASAAARRVAESLDALDREINALAGIVPAGERERVVEKLNALDHSTAHSEIRQMLQKQLDLLRDLETRLADAQARRARRIEMLRTLWLHSTQLALGGDASRGQTSERILALCDEIALHVQITATTARAGSGVTDRIHDLPTVQHAQDG